MDELDKRKKGGLSNKKYILWGTGGYGLKYDLKLKIFSLSMVYPCRP